MKITRAQFPKIMDGFEMIIHDVCADKLPEQSWDCPEQLAETEIGMAEIGLAALDKDDFETLCIGDQLEQFKLAQRNPNLMAAHRVFVAFWDIYIEGLPESLYLELADDEGDELE